MKRLSAILLVALILASCQPRYAIGPAEEQRPAEEQKKQANVATTTVKGTAFILKPWWVLPNQTESCSKAYIVRVDEEAKVVRVGKKAKDEEAKDVRVSKKAEDEEAEDVRVSKKAKDEEAEDVRVSKKAKDEEAKDVRVSKKAKDEEAEDVRVSKEAEDEEAEDVINVKEAMEELFGNDIGGSSHIFDILPNPLFAIEPSVGSSVGCENDGTGSFSFKNVEAGEYYVVVQGSWFAYMQRIKVCKGEGEKWQVQPELKFYGKAPALLSILASFISSALAGAGIIL